MSQGLNVCMFIGNLGADPETRLTQGGTSVANLSLGVSSKWKDKQSGEVKERTEWVRVVLWNRLAEIARDYLKKGSRVHVSGELTTRKWQDNNGNDRYSTEIIARSMLLLDTKPRQESQQYPQTAPAQAPAQAPAPSDDDIPF